MTVIRRTCCGALSDRISKDGDDVIVKRKDEIDYFFKPHNADGLQVYESERVVYDCLVCGEENAVAIDTPFAEDDPVKFIKTDGTVIEK